jgi:prevent-host-death family protein
VSKVKIADLKNNLSRYLAQVRDGAEITVLDREQPIARIVPFVPRRRARTASGRDEYWTEDRLADLERRGTLRRGDPAATAAWLATSDPVKLATGGAVEVLLAMRRESSR